jgi:hypothetical protein
VISEKFCTFQRAGDSPFFSREWLIFQQRLSGLRVSPPVADDLRLRQNTNTTLPVAASVESPD